MLKLSFPIFTIVPPVGVEPTLLAELIFETSVSTIPPQGHIAPDYDIIDRKPTCENMQTVSLT